MNEGGGKLRNQSNNYRANPAPAFSMGWRREGGTEERGGFGKSRGKRGKEKERLVPRARETDTPPPPPRLSQSIDSSFSSLSSFSSSSLLLLAPFPHSPLDGGKRRRKKRKLNVGAPKKKDCCCRARKNLEVGGPEDFRGATNSCFSTLR